MPLAPAPLPDVRFFVDADLLGVGKALARVRKDLVHPGHRRCPDIQPDTPDSVWLTIVGNAGWVAISRNRRIRHNPVENRLLLHHGVRAIFMTSGAAMTSWDRLVLIVRHWDAIEASLDEEGSWVKSLTRYGLAELKLTGPRARVERSGHSRRPCTPAAAVHGAPTWTSSLAARQLGRGSATRAAWHSLESGSTW